MKKLLFVLLLASTSLFATDHPVACGDAAGLNAAVAAAVPGDTITLVANSGAQCVTTLSGLTLPKKSISHPTVEASLTLTIAAGAVNGCSVASGGSGYTIAPSVSVVGGRGKGALVHVGISSGAVNSCAVDAGGSGYSKAPTGIVYSPENFITIQTSATTSLPTEGRRYQIANHATISPKLIFTGTNPILAEQGTGLYDGASYYKFRGLEMTMTNASTVSLMVNLNTASHIVFEQNYMYPQPCPNDTPPYITNGRITFAANGWDLQFKDNYLPCWYGLTPGAVAGSTGVDAMNVVADSYGTGVIVDNNLLTGWFNPFFFGGGDPPASAAGSSTISSRAAGSATLAAPPAAVSLMALELPFEGNTVGISSISRAANVVTVVTSSPHGFLTGALVYPKGVTDTSFNVVYDGNGGATCIFKGDSGCREITAVNSTTFTYSQTAANASSSGGVIVPTTCQTGPASGCFLDVNVSSIVGNTVNFSHAWVSAFAWGTFDIMPTVPGILVKSSGLAQWDGPQVTDSEITRNYIQHNTAFDTWVATNNGSISKGCPGEVKFWNGGRMEANWCGGFPVSSVGFNGNSSRGSAPWVKISDISVQNNVFDRFVGLAFGNIEYEPIAAGDHMLVSNNIWAHTDNNNVSNAQANAYGPNNIVNYLNFSFTHNTILSGLPYTVYPCVNGTSPNGDCKTTKTFFVLAQSEHPFQIPGKPNVTFRDNILGLGAFGAQCGDGGGLAITNCWNTLTEDHNIMVSNSDGQCIQGTSCNWGPTQFPWANSTGAVAGQPKWYGVNGSWPNAAFVQWADVGLTNPNGGIFSLSSSSPGHNGASDGTDVGANLAAINAALGPDNPQLNLGGVTVSISPKVTGIPVLGTVQFSAAGATFTKNAGCLGSINSTNGLFTAMATPETCTITATIGSVSDTATVTVSTLTITPSNASVSVASTQQFQTNFNATFFASGGLINASGFWIAPNVNGTYTITATAINGGTTVVATITVTGQVTFIPLSTAPIAWNTTTTSGVPVSQVFTVSNLGTGSVTPTVALSGTGYSITANTCTGAIAGGGTCAVTVQLSAVPIQFYSGTLLITDSAGGSQRIPLGVNIPNSATFHLDPTNSTIAINTNEQLTPNLPAYCFTNFGTVDNTCLYSAPGTAGTATVTATQQTILAANLNTQPATIWHNCGNCGNTGGSSPTPHGTFTITAGDPETFSILPAGAFDNFFWWIVLGAPGDYNSTVDYTLAFDMQFPAQADKNASQAIEFELQKNVLDHQYSMAWQICFACGNKLRVFNKTGHFWEDTGLTFDPAMFAGGKWVSVQTVYHLTTGTNTRHVSIALNGVNHVVNIDHAPTPAVESDYLHPAFQMDTNSAATPYSVRVKNFTVGSQTATIATATVNVVSVISNAVSPKTVTLPINGIQQFTATSSSTWSASCGTLNVATGTTVSYTAPNSAQSCTITATNGSGGADSAVVTVLTVAVNPSAVTMRVNSVQQFTANVPVSWSAAAGTIDSAGRYVAPSSPTSTTVTATALNGGATGTSTVTVQNPPPGSVGSKQKGGKNKARVLR
jgi:hypothetical protein